MSRPDLRWSVLGAAVLAVGLGWAPVQAAPIDQIQIGSSEDKVYGLLGTPHGQVKGDDFVVLFYDGGGVELRDGRVSRVDPKFNDRAEARRREANRPTAKNFRAKADQLATWARARFNTLLGKPPPAPAEEPAAPPSVPRGMPGGAPVKKISNNGDAVDLGRLLVDGQVTVVDFYADWCGPCKRVAPKLSLMARQDGEVYLRKVDIVRWGTPVARQYSIDSIPHIRVYNRDGQMIGKPTSNFNEVIRYVAMAK